MEFEPMLTPREKSPLPKISPEEDRTRDAVDSEPKHCQLSYSENGISPLHNMLEIHQSGSEPSISSAQTHTKAVIILHKH